MRSEERKILLDIGKKIRELYPGKYGNVSFRFNLNPNKKDVNINIITEFSEILKKD